MRLGLRVKYADLIEEYKRQGIKLMLGVASQCKNCWTIETAENQERQRRKQGKPLKDTLESRIYRNEEGLEVVKCNTCHKEVLVSDLFFYSGKPWGICRPCQRFRVYKNRYIRLVGKISPENTTLINDIKNAEGRDRIQTLLEVSGIRAYRRVQAEERRALHAKLRRLHQGHVWFLRTRGSKKAPLSKDDERFRGASDVSVLSVPKVQI